MTFLFEIWKQLCLVSCRRTLIYLIDYLSFSLSCLFLSFLYFYICVHVFIALFLKLTINNFLVEILKADQRFMSGLRYFLSFSFLFFFFSFFFFCHAVLVCDINNEAFFLINFIKKRLWNNQSLLNAPRKNWL